MDIADTRNFATGWDLPREGYCDQPYVVIADDGAWVCVMTTGTGVEGEHGQHVVSMRSSDRGRTWTPPVDIEPASGPEASWVMPLKLPDGRIFAFYTYNEKDLRSVISDDGEIRRVDTFGAFAFKMSTDHGNTWSRRHIIPVRPFAIDRENPYGGDILFWWGVSKPIVHAAAAYVGFSKVGRFGHGFMARSEGAFLRSENILTEKDPAKIIWDTLPQGDVGLRAPGGPVADEHNLVGLDDGSLYCTYRTIDGFNCAAYSRDAGKSWTPPAYAEYTPGGRRIKHPRAANFVRRLSQGRFILWYHNNGTPWYNNDRWAGNRNVAWLLGGREIDGHLHWGQPEIVVYNDNFLRGSSYPDFVEESDGRLYIVSTQKSDARVLEVSPDLLVGLWDPPTEAATVDLLLDLKGSALTAGAEHGHPPLPSFYGPWKPHTFDPPLAGRGGLTLETWLRVDGVAPGQVLVDNRDEGGAGFALITAGGGSVRLELCDGWTAAFWESDPGLLEQGRDHHVVAIADGGPKVILFVIDGMVCDGGQARPYGWGRFSPTMKDCSGARRLRIGTEGVRHLRLYGRALRVAEVIGNHRAGP